MYFCRSNMEKLVTSKKLKEDELKDLSKIITSNKNNLDQCLLDLREMQATRENLQQELEQEFGESLPDDDRQKVRATIFEI